MVTGLSQVRRPPPPVLQTYYTSHTHEPHKFHPSHASPCCRCNKGGFCISQASHHACTLPLVLHPYLQLTRLAVSACSLGELSAGPYLGSLRELVLFANNLR